MKKYYLLLFFFCFLQLSQQLQAQGNKPAVLQGQLIDAETSVPIPFAHISNLQRGLRALSDSSGYFRLPAVEGDSLLVSSVSYGQQKIVAPAKGEKAFIIALTPNVYELEEVVVQGLPSERRFKEMLLSMESPEGKAKPDLRLPEELPVAPNADGGTLGVSLGGGISGIAGKFSKKERGRRFAAEMQVKEERKAYIRTKFNRAIVQEITGLEDEEKLDAFMKYCALNESFLYEASGYEIHKAVLGCFGVFVEQQEG